jgi:serine/threonine-protein kinase HipA
MITKLTVYLNQQKKQKVGTLAQKDKKIYFEYDKEFLKSGLEISPYKLPLKSGVFRCDDDTFDGIWGVFADSLPDGWGRLLLDRYLLRLGKNPRELTPLDRLAYVGSGAMGALGYEPSEPVVEENLQEITLDKLFRSSLSILAGSSEHLIDELLALGGSSGGARPKVLLQLREETKEIIFAKESLVDGYSHYMVKFPSSQDIPQMGAVEYAYSLMAKDAGVKMPSTFLLEGKEQKYFAVKRFDRENEEQLHMHSVAGLVHSDFRYPTLDYDDLLRLTLHLTKNMQEVKKVFRLACFNLFTHNRDDHAKNFSYLMDKNGVWSFAPAYDLVFSYGVGSEHSTMFLGEGRNPTKEHLLRLAKKHSIKEGNIIVDEVLSAVERWNQYADMAGIKKKIILEIQKEFIL